MKMKNETLKTLGAIFALAVCLGAGPTNNSWAASVGPAGYTNDFSTRPLAADWATSSMGASSGTYSNASSLDAGVSNVLASSITSQVGSTATLPPAAATTAVWNSTGLCLQSRPTTIGAVLLLAKLVNNSGTNGTAVYLNYDFVAMSSVTEEVPGFRVYYSTTGGSGSWVLMPALCSAVSAHLSTNMPLASSWTNGGPLYLLFVDDNGSGSPDRVSQIASFFVAVSMAPLAPVNIFSQPESLIRAEGESATFSVLADGWPAPTYQWFKGSASIPDATNSSYTIAAVALNDAGVFSVVVSNDFSQVTSSNATLAVFPAVNVAYCAGPWPGYQRGPAQHLRIFGSRAYVSLAAGELSIIDLSDPTHPMRLGGFAGGGFMGDMVDGLAYFASRTNGVEIMNVTNPTNLVRIGNVGQAYVSRARDVQVIGSHGYVAVNVGGVGVFTVSNPANPVYLGGWSAFGNSGSLRKMGNRLLSTWQYSLGLAMLDVSTPGSLILTGTNSQAQSAYDVDFQGNYAYVAGNNPSLQVIDLSNPTNLVSVGSYDTPYPAPGVTVAGQHVFLADYYDGLLVFDVSNPTNLVLVGNYDTDGYAQDVEVTGHYAYVADDRCGLHVFDIQNPTVPVWAGALAEISGFASDVQIVGNYAYVADGGAGLQVIDVHDPAHPVRVGGFQRAVDSRGLRVAGTRAYLADRYDWMILDVADVSNPKLLAKQSSTWRNYDIEPAGSYVYVADLSSLEVHDVSNPTTLVLRGALPVASSYAYRLQILNNTIFAAWPDQGLKIIDVSTATNPVVLGSYVTNCAANDVQVRGRYAYIAGGSNGLQILDVNNPANPVLVGTCDTTGSAMGVCLSGDYVFVADGASGVQVIDVSNPAQPTRVGGYDTPGTATAVRVVGQTVFVADGASGLLILEATNLAPSAPQILMQPQDQTVNAGAALKLSVDVRGSFPLTYAWSKNGSPLDGATNAVLQMTAAQGVDSGTYSVVVSNTTGTVLSSNAVVVVRDAPRFDVSSGWLGTNGIIRLVVTGLTGQHSTVIEASTNLPSWFPVFTNTAPVSFFEFLDPFPSNLPCRFFRAVVP